MNITSLELSAPSWWHADDLGKPLPNSPHAVSMALPLWEHVVGYEEKRSEVMSRLSTGYPRFLIHPLVREVGLELSQSGPCLPLASQKAAEDCCRFIQRFGQKARFVSRRGMSGVCTDAAGGDLLKAYWQHTGLIVSTRQAEAWLSGREEKASGAETRHALKARLAKFYDCEPGDVLLCPTGMAAQYFALQVLQARTPGRPTIQLGFPYVDALKLQEKLGHGGVLLHELGTLVADLERHLTTNSVAGCFCEIPGNPLLGSANLSEVSPVLRRHGLPLVVDDVVATPYNIDANRYADMVATSLTKFIAGSGEVMGGAVIFNPRSPLYAELKSIGFKLHEDLLWQEDAEVLLSASEDFETRMERHNATGLLIAERLRAHPAVERVWYPKWEFSRAYESVRRPNGGWGALITFLPKNAEKRSALIYDRLELPKGPSLGTVFSLVCPFTLLAHYTELEWAESCGVSRYLLRLSAGLEDPEEIWRKLEKALSV